MRVQTVLLVVLSCALLLSLCTVYVLLNRPSAEHPAAVPLICRPTSSSLAVALLKVPAPGPEAAGLAGRSAAPAPAAVRG
ncbi:hypothetical protein I3F58_21465 [Streptomyces sp. MUM 203J]|uniref:hypothetical protein n=1 Tax=Streptomyces sp. MUM 203J TaxID=2791990 RepID=UPI001F04D46B|nr:hypothetical protein [Streptomyces sp. MUM 203J]MCH0542082.1 hypothetical protein [Streptomyces sp. MUM 203J]